MTTSELSKRIWPQVRYGLDKERLLPDVDTRRRRLAEKLDRDLDTNGWRIFVSGQALTILEGKPSAACNAEVALVETVRDWKSAVDELLPDRIPDLTKIVDYGLANPGRPPGRKNR